MKRIQDQKQLRQLARELGVRPDWHEPDEQCIDAVARGHSFDNAGFWPYEVGMSVFVEEMHVLLYRTEVNERGQTKHVGEPIAAVNLATLFAWASAPQLDETDVVNGERAERRWRQQLSAELHALAQEVETGASSGESGTAQVLGATTSHVMDAVIGEVIKEAARHIARSTR